MKDAPVEEDPSDLAPMNLADDEIYDQPLAAAGSSEVQSQLAQISSRDKVDDTEFDTSFRLPYAPLSPPVVRPKPATPIAPQYTKWNQPKPMTPQQIQIMQLIQDILNT